jgi:hypothetical protein
MRLWSIHPKYLDRVGLVAAWREALLARAVLAGRTRGYRRHPQLERFRAHAHPGPAIDRFLAGLHAESAERGYRFDLSKLCDGATVARIPVNRGQLDFELEWLKRKLWRRDRRQHARLRAVRQPDPHPLFRARPGGIEPWERGGGDNGQ